MSKASLIALILACSIVVMVSPGLAAAGTEQAESLSTPLFGHQDPAVEKCLSTLKSVHGCAAEIITSILSHRVELIGSTCCEAFNEVDDNCRPKVFHFSPFFPQLIKNHCAQMTAGPSPLPSSIN